MINYESSITVGSKNKKKTAGLAEQMNRTHGMPGERPGNIVAVVGKPTGLTALLKQLQRQTSSYEFRLYPDLGVFQDSAPIQCVLIDLSKKTGLGLDAFAELKIALPRIPILALTDREDTSKAMAAVENGACDYLFIDETSPAAIRLACNLLQAQQEADEQAHFLSKHVIQLNLLYAISNVMAEEEDFYAIKQQIIDLIPGSLKHLGITGARLNQGNLLLASNGFDETKTLKTFDVLSQGAVVAQLELCSESDQSFINADTSLFGLIIERLGKLISRHRMVEELQEHQLRLEFAMQAADLGYWEHDLISGKAWWSNKTSQLFGKNPPFEHTVEQLAGLIHRDDSDRVKLIFANAMANYGRAEAEYRIVLPNGGIRWLHDRGQCIQSVTGHYTKMIGVVSDITERKKADAALRTSENTFRSTYTHAPVGIALLDKDGHWIEINKKYCDITGYSREELLNSDKKFIELTDPEFRTLLLEHIRQIDSGEKPFYCLEKRLIRKDGVKVWVRVTASCVRDVAGKLQFYTAVVEDITERWQAKEALVKSESAYRKQSHLLETVLESMSEGVLYLDQHQQVVWANPAAKQIIDLAANQVGLDQWPKTYGIYLPDMRTYYPAENLPMARVLKGELVIRDEMVIRQPGQTAETWVNVNASPLHDSTGKLLGGLIVMRDITIRKQAEYRLALSAQFDAQTGLPNRNTVLDRLDTAICRAVQLEKSVAVLRLDLDHFAEINEQFGHETADRILAYIGQQLKGCLKETDTIGRFSGDEFVIILDSIPDDHYAELAAARILKMLSLPIRVDGIEINQTVSIGIAFYPEHGESSSILIQRASTALRHAKVQGRNNSQLYTSSLTTRQLAALDLKADLRKAIDNDELILHYQPQVELGSGLITGVEALIRWNHPRLGLLSPSQFISLAENVGIITSIGEWVLSTACRQAVTWQEAGLAPIKIAVKISAMQLRQRGFGEEISGIVQSTGLDPAYLDLEIAEGLLASDIQFSIEALKDLKSMGVQLTLDDFGSGYSSLNYLFDLPLDTIRFDGAFVRYLLSEDFHPKLARTVISLAHSMNMQVMAEGVETQDQLNWLKQHRCDVAQGHLISYPLTADEITELLKKKRKLM